MSSECGRPKRILSWSTWLLIVLANKILIWHLGSMWYLCVYVYVYVYVFYVYVFYVYYGIYIFIYVYLW